MAAGDRWAKLKGIVGSIFQLGLGGPNLKNSSGVIQARNAADSAFASVQVNDIVLTDDDSNTISLRTPANLGANYSLELPPDDGSPNQVLATDGSGVLSWQPNGSAADKESVDTTTLAFGDSSPKAMFTLPANAVIRKVAVIVDTAFNGTTPTASVGISGNTSKYMAATEIDLKTTGVYETDPGVAPSGSPENLEVAYTASGSTAGSARILVEYAVPA